MISLWLLQQSRITLIAAISGDGVVLPPASVMDAEHFLHHFLNTNLADDYLLPVSSSSYSNDNMAYH
jgi:hypothetical protein